jgi:hypothetical protein
LVPRCIVTLRNTASGALVPSHDSRFRRESAMSRY